MGVLVPRKLIAVLVGVIWIPGSLLLANPLRTQNGPSQISLESQLSNPTDAQNLRHQIAVLFDALNRRDLGALKSQIGPTHIFVEIAGSPGAYLTSSQTVAVMESFLRSHSSLSAKFEFDNSEGNSGSASGTLTARRNGRNFSYRLNFGFTRNQVGNWLLTRISMR